MKIVNLSKVVRDIDYLGQAILKDIGDTLAAGIWDEFETLVMETAQWTGTTAASWNLYMKYRMVAPEGDVRDMGKRTRAQALQKGHMHAVAVALNANLGRLDEITTDYRTSDIVISNNAPGSERAESGPLRDVNQGAAGALARFEQRVASKQWNVIRNREI